MAGSAGMTTVWSSAARKMHTITLNITRSISACEKYGGIGSGCRVNEMDASGIVVSRLVIQHRRSPLTEHATHQPGQE